ncbi:MAG: crotonase/enoyl-CoA hydratase family protein [Hyphomicrobiaceae bacterium]
MTIDVEREGGVQTLRFNRPDKKNAITAGMYEALAQAFEGGEWSDEVRVHLIAGTEGAFTAGNDLKDFLAAAQSGTHGDQALSFLRTLASIKKPLVAAVDGLAVGIGTTMLFHCDLVYASTAATFHTPFLDLGLLPEAASSLLMPRSIGHQRAFEMLCLGQKYDSERAYQAGFVNEVLPRDELEPYARQAALQLAGKPPKALALARALMRGSPDEVLARIQEEGALFADRINSPEARAAFEAFFERRPPDPSNKGAA